MKIIRSGTNPSAPGPDDYFTGTVRIDPLFAAEEPGRASGAHVTFEPGARTAWHTHPAGAGVRRGLQGLSSAPALIHALNICKEPTGENTAGPACQGNDTGYTGSNWRSAGIPILDTGIDALVEYKHIAQCKHEKAEFPKGRTAADNGGSNPCKHHQPSHENQSKTGMRYWQ